MQLLISTEGTVRCLYDEKFDLSTLGPLAMRRGAAVVERRERSIAGRARAMEGEADEVVRVVVGGIDRGGGARQVMKRSKP